MMNKSRYVFLDGIRGIAAIFVLMRHTEGYWNISFYRSYLAVDLFFILSGFVIAYAYDEKFRDGIITLPKFILIRLIRLYPVYLLSLLLCATILIHNLTIHPYAHERLMGLVNMTAMTALFLPSHVEGNPWLFPMNLIYWSLLFELLANLLYAVIRPLLNNIGLTVMVVVSGLMLAGVSHQHGNLDAGNMWGSESVAAGLTRSVFGIFMGLWLYRHRIFYEKYIGKFLSPWLAVIAIVLILVSPGVEDSDWLIDIVAVAVVFPLCVLCASQGKSTRLDKVLLMLGSASYPIYVFHVPASGLLAGLLKDNVETWAPYSGIILVVALVTLSILVEKFYDIPLRRWVSSFVYMKRGRAG